jgi:hypothetical protein
MAPVAAGQCEIGEEAWGLADTEPNGCRGKGDLIEPIRNLKDLCDRLVIIDPDPQNPVAIKPLDIAHVDLAQSVDLLEYFFGSLLEFKMTAMQTTLFRSVLRALVVAFPQPTLETFRDLLANGTKPRPSNSRNNRGKATNPT